MPAAVKTESDIASEAEQELRVQIEAEVRSELEAAEREKLDREVTYRVAERLRNRLPGAISAKKKK